MTEIVPLSDLTTPQFDAALRDGALHDGSLHDGALRWGALRGGVLSIGNFDGVHLGHAAMLAQTKELADKLDGPTIACLFDPHPIAILRPELTPQRLTTVEERARRMSRLGIDFLVVCRTSTDLLELSAEQFFHSLVRDILQCRGLVEGENFCFGKDRGGDVNLLRRLCKRSGIDFRVAEMRSCNGEMISSTRIRDLLNAGDVGGAAALMATPHVISGIVVHGDGRGRTIGFPTANLEQIDVVVPAAGVYAATATVDHTEYPAAIHIGESPTFGSGDPSKVEAHLIGFDGDLYGQSITLGLIGRVRGIVRFDSAEALAEQLRSDIQSARQMLAQHQDERSR